MEPPDLPVPPSLDGAATPLVHAIEAGDLDAMLLLLERGAKFDIDVDGTNPVLSAACAQPDSDLLKQLLARGIDLAPYPRCVGADSEASRLLRQARAGARPIVGPPPKSRWWTDCAVCKALPDHMGWCHTASGERTGAPLPAITEQFETFGDLWKCPWCWTYYEHERDHDNGITDGWDSESLRRIHVLERALLLLRGMSGGGGPTPRIDREIASVTRAIYFEDIKALPGDKFQISGERVRDGRRVVMIYSLGDTGARQLIGRWVPEAEHAQLVADLKTRGFPAAETDFDSDSNFVWVRNADGLEVFDDTGRVFAAAGERATLDDDRVLARTDIARVIAFADGYVVRGVKAVLRSGEQVALITETSTSATIDPFYTRNQLLSETGWCAALAIAIAHWVGVAFENLI